MTVLIDLSKQFKLLYVYIYKIDAFLLFVNCRFIKMIFPKHIAYVAGTYRSVFKDLLLNKKFFRLKQNWKLFTIRIDNIFKIEMI